MKIRSTRADLLAAIAPVAQAIPNRPTTPILAAALLTATADTITIAGYDYETSVTAPFDGEVGEPGQVLASGKLLEAIVKHLPNKPVDLSFDGVRLNVEAGQAQFSLPTLPFEDYPQLPKVGELAEAPEGFTAAVRRVDAARGKDDSLPMLTGIKILANPDDRTITLAATDRFRLTVATIADSDLPEIDLLVPGESLANAVKKYDGPMQIGADDSGLLATATDTATTTMRLLDADFPKFRQLLPTRHNSVAAVNIADLTGAIKRAQLMAERGSQVRLSFGDHGLTVAAGGSDVGTAEETVPAQHQGEPITIAFNPAYLIDGLNAVGGQTVHLGFTNPSRPALLTAGDDLPQPLDDGQYPAADTDFQYLLMPVRLPG